MKQRLFAALMVTALTAGMLTGCGEKDTPKKEETTQESGQTGTTDTTGEAASEEDTEAAGFTDGEELEADASDEDTSTEETLLDVSQELTGIHHAEIVIKDYGTLELELDADTAPITVTNFVKLAQEDFYDGLTFHRIIDGFMIQGGDPLGNGTGGSEETIKGEFASNGVENNLSHKRGVISMARSQMPDSASSQFFICHADSPHLDGEYAAFGTVTKGMDIVDAICEAAKPVDNNGSIPAAEQPVMETVTILD